MTPRKLTPEQKIVKALRGLDLDDLGLAVKKDQIINLRVTEDQKAEIQAVAEALGLTVASYLLALHEAVKERGRR